MDAMALEEVAIANPKLFLAIVSILVTLISTVAHKYLTDQEKLKHLKKRQKEIQKELRSCKDPKKLSSLNSEMMKLTGVMFKGSMRPIMFTFVPFILLFIWLREIYVPIMGNSWLWYYIGYSIVASIILRKVLKVA